MGAVPAARRAGRAVSVGSARRRQGRAARRTRAAELGRAALGRYPRAEGLIMASLKLPTSSRRLEPYRTGAPSPFPAAAAVPGAIVFSGAGTDHLPPGPHVGIDDVIGAYEEQCAAIEKLGGRIVLMASRALAAAARGPDDYAKVYGRVLSRVREPVIIHWLGDMFDPALAGYWGHADPKPAMEVCLAVLADHAEKIDGVKISLPRLACCAIRISPHDACARCWQRMASKPDAPRSRAAVAQHRHRAGAMEARRDHRRLRAARHPRHRALARPDCGARTQRDEAPDPRLRPDRDRAVPRRFFH